MNWNKIRTQSPLAFKSILMPICPNVIRDIFDSCNVIETPQKEIVFGSVVMKQYIPMPYHRLLYDFFDSQRIFVVAGPMDATISLFSKEGKLLKETRIEPQGKRNLTEFTAFEKAFEFLEIEISERLTKNG